MIGLVHKQVWKHHFMTCQWQYLQSKNGVLCFMFVKVSEPLRSFHECEPRRNTWTLVLLQYVYIFWPSLCALFSLQKLKATVSQPLPQVANEDGEIQSSAVTHTPAPTSPSGSPAQAAPAALTPAPISHLSKSEEPSPHALQQPATSTTETPVRVSAQDKITLAYNGASVPVYEGSDASNSFFCC